MRAITEPGPTRCAVENASLVARACQGDEAAWRGLIDLYSRRIYVLVRSRTGRDDIAEEVTQSVFVTVAENFSKGAYHEQGKFEAWLFRIAMNRLRDDRRRNKRAPISLDDAPAGMLCAPAPSPNEDDSSSKPLREAMEKLNDADQQIISLRHHAGLEFHAIAELLDQPLGTVLARHHRAIGKLRTMLNAPDEDTKS